jgi:hypothetical protein
MGWLMINVLLPLLAPLLVLAILKALPIPPANRLALNLLIPIKDGQLCWAAISLSASALYEIGAGKSVLSTTSIGYLHGAAVFLIATSSIVAAGGAIFPTSLVRPRGISPICHYSTLVFSVFLAVWAALVRVVVQFGL